MTPADVVQRLQHLEVHTLGSHATMHLVPCSLVEVLSELVGPGEGLLGVAVEEVLLVGQVAELVGGGHLELVVLQWCQHHGGVLKQNTNDCVRRKSQP